MTSDALPFAIPREPGRIESVVLAVLMHALLLAFLWIGISWVNEAPQSIDPDYVFTQQELNTPQPEPVPVPTPKVEDQTPPVPDPDIATAQEKKRLKEDQEEKDKIAKQKQLEEQRKQEELQEQKDKEKQEADKKKREEEQKKADEKKQQQEDQKRMQKMRDDERARITREAGGNPGASSPTVPGKPGTGNAAWIGKVQAKIKSLIIFNPGPGADPNATAQFDVSLLPDGSVASVRLTRSSGISAWDDAVKRAIENAQPYPADSSSGTVPRQFTSSNRLGDQK